MKTLLLCVTVLWASHLSAQLVDVINEVYFESGGIGDIPGGYTTYRIYARLQDPTDRIHAVFGSPPQLTNHHLHIHSSEAGNAIYNSSFAGTLGTDNHCAFWSFFPSMPYDSYVTFQATNSPLDTCLECSPTGTIFQISSPAGIIPGTFATAPFGPDLTLVDGSWFIPNESSCYGFPQGEDNRILIAQVTLPTGTLEYWLNISIYDEGISANQLIYTHYMQGSCEVAVCPEINGTCLGLVYPMNNSCSDWGACNFVQYSYCIDNSICTYPGCTDECAINYNPAAGCDDQSCEYGLTGDFNEDEVVNTTDLLILMSAFGCLYDCETTDLNCDGVVNIIDLLVFMAAF